MGTALAIFVFVLVFAFVGYPFFGSKEPASGADDAIDAEIRELEAVKELKLSEIREAEADFGVHKLSDKDHKEIDGRLRQEAIEAIRKLDQLKNEKKEKKGRL